MYIIFERWSQATLEFKRHPAGLVAVDWIDTELCRDECDALHVSLLNWGSASGLSYDASTGHWMNDATGRIAVWDGDSSGELSGDCEVFAVHRDDMDENMKRAYAIYAARTGLE
jgi:hypothetical protein